MPFPVTRRFARPLRRRASIVAVVLFALALAACSSSGGHASTTGAVSSTSAGSAEAGTTTSVDGVNGAGLDPCRVLTSAMVADLVGTGLPAPAAPVAVGTASQCRYVSADGTRVVTLLVDRGTGRTLSQRAAYAAAGLPITPVAGVGRQAFVTGRYPVESVHGPQGRTIFVATATRDFSLSVQNGSADTPLIPLADAARSVVRGLAS
jgi:hypothetical protein